MLTQLQRDRLHAAIDDAQGPGRCRYVIGNQPGCIIAQLATLEGATLEELLSWEGGSVTHGDYFRTNSMEKRLGAYPPGLLKDLQRYFDTSSHTRTSASETKGCMWSMVDAYMEGS